MWSPTAATLIYGERDAVLVDPLMTLAEGEDLAGWVAASGKNLTTIFVTHGHGDHWFGAAPVLDRFPDAKLVATPAVVGGMHQNLSPAWLDGFWRDRFPGQLPDRFVVAEPLDLYLAESVAGGIAHWLAALDVLDGLHPTAVVSGHRQADASDDPRYIDETRRYLKAFAAAESRTDTALELYNAVLEEYPNRLNRGVLWNSTRAIKSN